MAWWRTAYVGQKVTPVNRTGWFNKGISDLGPAYGDVCTICGIQVDHDPDNETGIAIFLSEWQPDAVGFSPSSLRPVDDLHKQKGMAVFRAILNGAPVREDA